MPIAAIQGRLVPVFWHLSASAQAYNIQIGKYSETKIYSINIKIAQTYLCNEVKIVLITFQKIIKNKEFIISK